MKASRKQTLKQYFWKWHKSTSQDKRKKTKNTWLTKEAIAIARQRRALKAEGGSITDHRTPKQVFGVVVMQFT